MVSLSSEQRELAKRTLLQIQSAIIQLNEWNTDVVSVDDWLHSSEGMRRLAANCMLIEAIGEGLKKVDKRTEGQLLLLRPEIPWQEVMAMRNHIAHGYFDIDAEFVYGVIKNDLLPLLEAVDFLITQL